MKRFHSRKKDKCSANVVQTALVDAAREVFVKYDAVMLVPPPPPLQEWVKFKPTAQAGKKGATKPKAKARGRPKKGKSSFLVLPQELKGKLQKTSSFDEAAVDVTVVEEKRKRMGLQSLSLYLGFTVKNRICTMNKVY